MSIRPEYEDVAKAIEKALSPVATISVQQITACEKPRVTGDLRIEFTVENNASLGNGKRLIEALNSVAHMDGAPRSLSTSSTGYITHLKPSADIFK